MANTYFDDGTERTASTLAGDEAISMAKNIVLEFVKSMGIKEFASMILAAYTTKLSIMVGKQAISGTIKTRVRK